MVLIDKYHLHSTMFILKLDKPTVSKGGKIFTFHYVYIKTLEPKTFNFQGSKLLLLSMLQKIYLHYDIFSIRNYLHLNFTCIRGSVNPPGILQY